MNSVATTHSSDADSMLAILHERQQHILSKLPTFSKTTISIALVGLLATFVTKILTSESPSSYVASLVASPSLANLIAFALGAFSSLIIWMFVIWSLSFVPFIAYYAHKSSKDNKLGVVTKPFRWVQLYAATFLPMIIFATAWNSSPALENINVIISIQNITELIIVASGAIIIAITLGLVNRNVPIKLVSLRLSVFSSLLYLALFLAYGRGYGLASHVMVYGILLYLMFDSNQIGEIGRRIALHDVDPEVAERFDDIATRQQEVKSIEDTIKLKEKEQEAKAAKQKLEMNSARSDNEMALSGQLIEIKKKKMALNKDINTVQLQVLETKITTLSDVFGILSKELDSKNKSEIPEALGKLRESVKNYSPGAIQEKMNAIICEMNAGLRGIPESLDELREQLILTSTEIEKQTKLMSGSSNEENAGES